METTIDTDVRRGPWNKGRLIDQRPPLKQKKSGQYAFGCN